MPQGIFITTKDVLIIYGYNSYVSALNKYNLVRDALGKQRGQKITVTEFANAENIPVEEVHLALGIKTLTK